jgi:hypothetical protein
MLGKAPNGQPHLLAPQRMFLITAAGAVLAGQDLGKPVRARVNPQIGPWRLPAGSWPWGADSFSTAGFESEVGMHALTP